MTNPRTILTLYLLFIFNAVSALLLVETTRDISVIINRIGRSLGLATIGWAMVVLLLSTLFIKNDDIGLLSFAFTCVKVVEGLLYTTNTTQTFHIFIFSSILMLQLIPITLIMVGLVFLVTLASLTFIPEWNEERMKGLKARLTVLTLIIYVRTTCFCHLLTIKNYWGGGGTSEVRFKSHALSIWDKLKFATLPWLLLSDNALVLIGLKFFYYVIFASVYLLHFHELLYSNLEANSMALLVIFPASCFFRRNYSSSAPPVVVPVKIYRNDDLDKLKIIKENKGKSGIYRWVNLNSGKSYIGSSVNLAQRLKNYFSVSYISDKKRGKSLINAALSKYGYSNFSLEILEYCDRDKAIKREQYYFDLLSPEYNILKKAGSLFGYKHSKESLLKRKGRTWSRSALTGKQRDEHLERLKILNESKEQK